MLFYALPVKAGVVLAVHVLLWMCLAENAAALKTSKLSGETAATDVSFADAPSTTVTPEESTDLTTTAAPPPYREDTAGATDTPFAYQVGSEPSTVTISVPSDVPELDAKIAWIQRIRRPAKGRSLLSPAATDDALPIVRARRSATLGQVIAEVLYGAPWTTHRTSEKCADDMRVYNDYLLNNTLWAVKMLDATSKGPEGQFYGSTFSFGNFDECINTKSKVHGIKGGYSLVDIDFRPSHKMYPEYYDGNHLKDYDEDDEDESAWEAIKHNIQDDYVQRHKFQWAVCLPENCHYEDVRKIVSDSFIPQLNRHGMEGNVTIDPQLHTSSLNTYKYNKAFYIACSMYGLAVVFLITGTYYDLVYLKYKPKSEHGPMKKIMKPFSVVSNMERLLKPSKSDEFSVINGLKVLSILQVILGHRLFLELGNPQSNPDFISSLIHNILFGHFTCTIFLETFFVISGFLTFYYITKLLTEKKSLNFIPILIYRWLRIFPVYATLIATYIFILPFLNDGPYWKMVIYRESERCQINWWTNVLFINNYVNTDEICIVPSWYLACDMHFFIAGTVITFIIWKWTRPGLVTLGVVLILSIVFPAYIIVRDQLRGLVDITPDSLKDLSKETFYTTVYVKSHMRSMTYFMGMATGYLYMKLKEENYQLSLKSRIFWVPTVLVTANLIYWSSGLFLIKGHQYNVYEHVIYFTVGRFVWALLTSYLIFGHGLSGLGAFSGLFGHRFFQILGKLVFCVYMYQEIVQLQTIASIKTPTYQNISLIAWRFCADTLSAFFYALAINVMIESPCDRLQKNIMKMFIGDVFSKDSTPQVSTEITIENRSTKMAA